MPIITAPKSPTHQLPGARFTSLATPTRGSISNSVWRVELSPNTPPTPHELTEEEIFVVLQGRARVRIGEESGEAGVGDCIAVPPQTPFEIEAAGTEDLVAICCMPVGGRARMSDGHELSPPWAE